MFKLRSVAKNDLDDLYELSQFYNLINLPSDRDAIEYKINCSLKSFKEQSKNLDEDHYVFVLEDMVKNKVIGCSMIHAQHGTEKEPHFYLKVGQENKYSQSINTGFIHGTLKLGYETNGPTEIGGLILSPKYRGNKNKLGKQLSFCRFLYMALNPNRFKKNIHSELLPPFDSEGKSALWEAIGRRFLNMEYQEADLLSSKNKEFILQLFPSEIIYETLLPIEARNAVGKVGIDTLPVKAMLESIGFKYTDEVDPFDGGPHYRVLLEDIKPIREQFSSSLSFSSEEGSSWYLINTSLNSHSFEACCVRATKEEEILRVEEQFSNILTIDTNTKYTIIPL